MSDQNRRTFRSAGVGASGERYRYTPADCLSDHESGMIYDPETDSAVCPLCGTHESTEMGSL